MGLPQIATELKESWLVVGNIDTSGASIASGSVTDGEISAVLLLNIVSKLMEQTSLQLTTIVMEIIKDCLNFHDCPIVSGSVLLSEAFQIIPAQLVDRILASANNTYFTTGSTSFLME